MSENVRVAVRVRPFLLTDQETTPAVVVGADNSVCVRDATRTLSSVYDYVLGPSATQAEVYAPLAASVAGALDGFNCAVLAYGQTGSGKTYTMFGNFGCNSTRNYEE